MSGVSSVMISQKRYLLLGREATIARNQEVVGLKSKSLGSSQPLRQRPKGRADRIQAYDLLLALQQLFLCAVKRLTSCCVEGYGAPGVT